MQVTQSKVLGSGSCAHGNETMGTTEERTLFEQLRHYQLPKSITPWSQLVSVLKNKTQNPTSRGNTG